VKPSLRRAARRAVAGLNRLPARTVVRVSWAPLIALWLLCSPPGQGDVDLALAGQNTVYQATPCQPRPRVVVSLTILSDGRAQGTVTAGLGTVHALRFGVLQDAALQLPDGSTHTSGGFTYTVPVGTVTTTFIMIRQAAGTVHVPFVVVDDCGDWSSFLGVGPSGWAPQVTPTATPTVPPSTSEYVFRDQFVGNAGPPLSSPLAADPGPGSWIVTDVESQIKKLSGRLRGLTQPVSPAWGESKLVGPGVPRTIGRAYVALLTLEDQNASIALGWDSATGTHDPSTVGQQILFGGSALQVTAPGRRIAVNNFGGGSGGSLRPMQYLVMVVAHDLGASYWVSTFANHTGGRDGDLDQIGIPAWPSMRLLWVDDGAAAGNFATLMPVISALGDGNGTIPPASYSYTNGHAVEDVRIVDLPAPWNQIDGMARFADRFNRTAGPGSLGGPWTSDGATWGISNNQAVTTGGTVAWAPSGTSDGIYSWDVTVPSGWNGSNAAFGGVLRRVDAGNYLLAWNNGSQQIALQVRKNGAFGGTIYSGFFNWQPNQTYRITVFARGNQYLLFVNGQVQNSGVWSTDAANNHLTGTGVGLYGADGAGGAILQSARWDNVSVYPFTAAAPAILSNGKTPGVYTPAATVGQDSFTGPNGTVLTGHAAEAGGGWTTTRISPVFGDPTTAAWQLQSNVLVAPLTGPRQATAENFAYQQLGVTDVEASVNVLTSASLNANTGVLRSGIVARYVDHENYIVVRLFKDPSQLNSDEIELIEARPGSTRVQHKVNVGAKFLPGHTYKLTVQVKGDTVQVLLDNEPRMTYILSNPALAAGTRFGIWRADIDSVDGSGPTATASFANWLVKRL
jgi:hypothetical protein